ncbi:TetR/AcrR family transcriptional regulator [Psychromicrobium sp. YIM B11713]|uniref:TetR/AcrR family transcriptional regulator n=1 Tax=Psychromicrobium sp. YIM B11713 TaxID=3145233 RepID=UPI00374F600C
MTSSTHGDTRSRLLDAAAELIARAPGEEFSLREVCNQVAVKMPTLYHFFGSKQGLIDAVVERGFDLYMGQKDGQESSGDPIQDIRQGWDAHVAFGLANPGFYSLMYGKVRPGYSPAPQARPSQLLRSLTRQAAAQGRLAADPDQAAAHILVTNIGVTLRQIILAQEDRELSIAVREGAIAAITGTSSSRRGRDDRLVAIHQVIEEVARHPEVLGVQESQLLSSWLIRLSENDSPSR